MKLMRVEMLIRIDETIPSGTNLNWIAESVGDMLEGTELIVSFKAEEVDDAEVR